MEKPSHGSVSRGQGERKSSLPLSAMKGARIMALGNLRHGAGAATLASRIAGAIRIPTAST
jgi:Flp pilus assembly CpaE family ATPase